MLSEVLSRGLLLIYQMPKTGSQTVEATLQETHLPCQVVRFHFLSSEIAGTIREALDSGRGSAQWRSDARDQLELISKIRRIIRWRQRLSRFRLPIPKLRIITGVREPIELALSSVFENHAFLFPDLQSATVEACRKELLRPVALKYLQDWFDVEIKTMLGIDVFQTRFPFAKGYATYENRFARLLVYRTDFLQHLPEMLSQFLGCRVPGIVNRNLGAAKEYAQAYAEVKARLRLPYEFVADQYNRKLMRHFFSDEERRRLLLRWADGVSEKESMPALA